MGRAAAAEKDPAIGLERRLADGVRTRFRRAAAGDDVQQPWRPLLRAAGPAGDQQRGPPGEDLGLHEEVGKGWMRLVLALRGERHLRVGGDLDRAAAFGVVGEGESAEFHVVFGGHADQRVCLDLLVEATELRP